MSIFMLGCGLNSMVVLIIQIFVLLFMDENKVVDTAIVYFWITSAFIATCLGFLWFVVLKHPLVMEKLAKKRVSP